MGPVREWHFRGQRAGCRAVCGIDMFAIDIQLRCIDKVLADVDARCAVIGDRGCAVGVLHETHIVVVPGRRIGWRWRRGGIDLESCACRCAGVARRIAHFDARCVGAVRQRICHGDRVLAASVCCSAVSLAVDGDFYFISRLRLARYGWFCDVSDVVAQNATVIGWC